MDINDPPAIVHPWVMTDKIPIVTLPASTTVLVITAEGKKMRGDRELKDLSRDELLVVIDDLIDLIKRR